MEPENKRLGPIKCRTRVTYLLDEDHIGRQALLGLLDRLALAFELLEFLVVPLLVYMSDDYVRKTDSD